MAVDIFEAMKQPVEQPAKSSGPVDVFEASGTTPGSSAVRRYVADPAISLLKSAIAVPETAVGLADIAAGGYAGKLAEKAGFRPKEAKNILNELYSPEQRAANYNVEQADQADITQPAGAGEIRAVWRGDLLGGVMALEGTWADGRPLRAIPNFARMNRGGAAHAGPGPRPRPGGPESLVWMKALP